MKKVFILFLVLTAFPAIVFAAGQVEINTASLEQLDEITGVGPVLAQRIVDARPFSSLDDLLKVKGIGEKTLQKIKDQGLAYVASAPPQTAPEVITTPVPIPVPTTVPTYPNGIFINEILPSPAGPDETDEWIELYNSNNITVNLENWKLQDIEGTTTDYAFPKGASIAGNAYLILKRPATKILLNNEGDGLNLISPDGAIVDTTTFEKAPKNQSYAKMGAGWIWNSNLTAGAANAILAKNSSPLSNSQKTDTKYVAAVAEPVINNDQKSETTTSNPWFLFLIALGITIVSAAIILFLKLKIINQKSHVRP